MKPVAPKPAVRKPAATKAKAPVAVEAKPAVSVPPVVEQPEPVKTIAAETEKATRTIIDTARETVETTAAVVEAEARKAAETLTAAPVAAASEKTVKTPVAKVNLMTAVPTAPFKGYDDFAAFSKANMDAFIQANQVFAKGIEEMSKEVMSLTQASMESAAAAAKAVFTAKTFKDVVDLNTDYTKTSFDKFVANSTKLSEMGVKVATDALAPVTARVNVAVEKILKPVA
ncbi:MAG TPA: TIGR01841 family phasin [Stellaceae bacterium]|jgi:phasin family protein|nr:TIGR01841 family phasin [Stellaceae bacterium]